MQQDLVGFATQSGFSWKISPADSPWRQGRSEVRIKLIKRLLTVAIGSVKLTPVELQTALFEIASLSNDRPIGINKTPSANGTYKVLTPNCLLLGRTQNALPDDVQIRSHLKHSERYELIQQVTRDFWSRWVSEVTPLSVIRQKWHDTGRNLRVGDLVLVHDKSPLKGNYTLAKVESVNTSQDGFVRSCMVQYRIPSSRDAIGQYTGGKLVSITRSVQRLTLLLAVEDQMGQMEVEGDQVIGQSLVKI